jgi:hypothetical protein
MCAAAATRRIVVDASASAAEGELAADVSPIRFRLRAQAGASMTIRKEERQRDQARRQTRGSGHHAEARRDEAHTDDMGPGSGHGIHDGTIDAMAAVVKCSVPNAASGAP